MTEKRFEYSDVWGWNIDGFLNVMNGLDRKNNELKERIKELEKENEQLKKDRFICLDCEHSGYTEIGCLCEKQDHWEEFKNECNDFKELKY